MGRFDCLSPGTLADELNGKACQSYCQQDKFFFGAFKHTDGTYFKCNWLSW